ncbi:MAG: DNA-protecting protein DprA [Actinomycetes bacterium]|jgi:DNA processing protein|nr:DNA-protecting protein DprA [Actinomycetes bacterium]
MPDKTRGTAQRRFEITADDAAYPEMLRFIEDPPATIYGRGNESALTAGVAIIGARNATPYGKAAAKMIAGWAADLGLVVYSGCARGCDQAAHRGALDAGGRTVAVLGCGADIAYPSRASDLLDEIAETGAVISGYPWGMPPMKHQFIARNRLIIALSRLLVVTEARLPSGTFSAVHHALDLGVPIAAVPGSIFCQESAAPNKLIAEGATLISSHEDFLIACGLIEGYLSTFAQEQTALDLDDDREEVDVTPADAILHALRAQPAGPDQLIEQLGFTGPVVLRTLTELEISAQVTRYPDGRYGAAA